MKSKRVTRYFCDHCGKGRQSKRCTIEHEKHCLRNPQRECRTCKEWDEFMEQLQAEDFDCPECMLSEDMRCREWGETPYDFQGEREKFRKRANELREAKYPTPTPSPDEIPF